MRRVTGTVFALLLTACSGDAPVTPPPVATICDGVSVAVRTLAPLERVVLSGADAACFALAGDNREYLVVPQFTGAALPYGGYGFRLVGLDSEAEVNLDGVEKSRPLALVLGAEGKGLREKTRATCDVVAKLDMPGAIKSLNVSIATAVSLYALTR